MTIIRKVVGDRFENHYKVSDEWTLRPQVEALESWLEDHREKLDPKDSWVADIGFTQRSDALGGGPPISRKLMQLCLDSNLEIYLSEYGPDDQT